MNFTKMHGIGNDYIYVNGFVEKVADAPAVARKISDRHFGVGGDGLILILPSTKADVRMQMFNADGSEAEMCGNGIRCVAKYAFDHGLSKANPMRVETGRGVLSLALKITSGKVGSVTVNMGAPILESPQIPFDPSKVIEKSHRHKFDYELSGKIYEFVPVSMGNPHATIFVSEVDAVDLNTLGKIAENHPAFPKRVNTHFAKIISRSEIQMRTWERGSGATWACGTGACAVVVAAILTDRTERNCLVHLPGGDLNIEWRESDNNVYMTGPAVEVFTGEWNA